MVKSQPNRFSSKGHRVSFFRMMVNSTHVLVVDDEPLVREFNVEMLSGCGYQVDAAEDGAAAWNTLQLNTYDLVITDNDMPNLTGVGLIEKMRASGMTVPVIMATSALPTEEFTLRPWLQPAATLLKPYAPADFLGSVKSVLCAAVATAMLAPAAFHQQSLTESGRKTA